MSMLEFAARVFRGWMNALFGFILFACGIAGCVIFGSTLGGLYFDAGYALLGLFVGCFVGLVIVILSGGFIANFLILVENSEKIKNHLLQNTGNKIVDSSNYWNCPKCSKANRGNALFCTGCGEKIN